MTTIQRDSITGLVEGLTIWNKTNKQLEVYDGSYWLNMNGILVSNINVGDSYGGGIVAYIFVSGDVGYVASSKLEAKYDGILEIDELKTVKRKNPDGQTVDVVIGRSAEMRIIDANTKIVLTTGNIPYGSQAYVKNNAKVKKGDMICDWDPYNAVIVSEFAGKIEFDNVEEGVTFREESDEQTGFKEKVIVESRDKSKNPAIKIVANKDTLRTYNIPVGAHVIVNDSAKIEAGHKNKHNTFFKKVAHKL